MTAQWVKSSFDYTGGQQTFVAPFTGYYKLEVWGASGGNGNWPTGGVVYRGGYGGYSIGIVSLSKNVTLYINIGGLGNSCNTEAATTGITYCNGGYNGDGSGLAGHEAKNQTYYSGGGGATHIATVSGLLKNLSSYKNTGGTNISKEILIVAGGGGGGLVHRYQDLTRGNYWTGQGGEGGGYSGVQGTSGGRSTGGTPGNQTSAGCGYTNTTQLDCGNFGLGATSSTSSWNSVYSSGGGGGWYGGGFGGFVGAGGGSGYIGSSNLISGGGITKHMTCYSCTTSTATATRTNSNTNVSGVATADYSKTGNGYARITWMGDTL